MEKPGGRTMASAFAMTNEVLHQAANKPTTSASMCRASDSDDEAMVGMDVEFATPSSDPSPEQQVNIFFIQSISFSNLSVYIHSCK